VLATPRDASHQHQADASDTTDEGPSISPAEPRVAGRASAPASTAGSEVERAPRPTTRRHVSLIVPDGGADSETVMATGLDR